ncbi:MAG TPA: hypothetical protein DIW30_05890 [Bacteroidales bacterium]|nr:hypothetical protein [Bacteroidales bacterium]
MLDEKDRLATLIQQENVSAKQFAEEVGIQPGTVSNILNGRNKPSLEVMQKVLKRYPQVSSDWLISGEEPMYRKKDDSQQALLFDIPTRTQVGPKYSATIPKGDSETAVASIEQNPMSQRSDSNLLFTAQHTQNTKKIQKIVVFFDDGTFEEFSHQEE